ncbi:MAG TPA: neutral zinc metallopeptidase [Actinoplanes sp.]|nr:neutral zinc metallopeptidase [Actinoplanes sp.]
MELNENADLDASQVNDLGRGSGGGRGGLGGLPIPLPSGPVGLIITVVLLLLGGGGYGLSQMDGDEPDPGANTALATRCAEPDKLADLRCRNLAYVVSIQDWWRDALPASFDRVYEPATTNYFQQSVRTACGAADSGVGPFYCPADRKVYLDLSFYRVLAEQLGAPGEFAQPYVLAHEYGHHVQTLLGTESDVRRRQQRDPGNANELSVRMELQADCYAGAWAKNAIGTDTKSGVKIFKSLTEQDIQQGLETASAIGDDAIQGRGGGRVDPHSFTHGTSAQRQKWFRTGYDSGDPRQCDTFTATAL